MDFDKPLNFTIYYIIPPLILIIGTTGNLFGIFTFHRSKLCKIGSKRIYKFIFVIDTLNLLNIIVMYMANGYGKDITLQTNISCKLAMYLNYTLAPMSPMLLIFNSIIKLISTKRQLESLLFWLKTKYVQFIYAIGIIIFNSVYYIPALFLIQLQYNPSSNLLFDSAHECTFIDISKQVILFSMDLFNRVFIPFTSMSLCSLFLMRQIVMMINEINRNLSAETKKRVLKRELKSTTTLVCLNMFYVLLNLPIVIIMFTQISFDSVLFSISLNLYYMSYGVNFYIILITNSMVRKEFLKIFKKKINNNSNSFNDENEISLPFWV